MDRVIPGADAWRNVAGNPVSRWNAPASVRGAGRTARARIAAGVVAPVVRPKFALHDDDTFFCIGSCFARNIEEHLMYRGFAVRSMGIARPYSEWPHRPNGFVNKFTTPSMLNELRWATGETCSPAACLVQDEGGWRDLQLAPGVGAVAYDAALERRGRVSEYFARIAHADVAIVTLGLVEAWFDRSADVYLNAPPNPWATRREPDRFALHVTSYATNVEHLRQIVTLLRAHARPGLRTIVSVSPVPMSETFTGEDVVAANAYSKATLRAAAEDVANEADDVQYFPSYDALTTTERRHAFRSDDELHVRDDAVETVTTSFLRAFGVERSRPHPEFDEMRYLDANHDLYGAIERGDVQSGYEHWLAYGRAEGRSLARDATVLAH